MAHKKKRFLYNYKLKEKARKLRKEPTPAERKLWQMLRGRRFLSIKFHRQIPIGPYIVDFCAFNPRVVIEIDGDSHYTSEARKADEHRDRYLMNLGFRVFRFTNREVLENLEGVLEYLEKNI
ncbi:endonuclease domain-containing protein [Thermosulfurimonas dismutans]|uniref:DUF559 domain-containing protein n=1 Tax=Thermosulfurimonas dismutans TaxID=999894 RepID=A0A179D3M6_9BACT|nr:endonuclease domain-containing protein [Thermosulfurimonas dismutans]OAQ20684.1 hypothetical protein TDIS_1299 [Thermosulfurimonas dismutans]